ncbi:Leucine Rich Repeat [Seminavis robusta]|uniref:Leucine Rich Repeat n=1 Tax=Seminavis robusta TaxID=568900 RepID=A0A9N8E3P1_9STRA|nr:Leucine Rich Repeat [Seminavis robusta]|eukprot:Sro469_g149380.1 Leucine Rich Repeat (752) ;mRNA; f:51954-54311
MKDEKDDFDILDVVAARLNDHSNHSSVATNGTSSHLDGQDVDVEAQTTTRNLTNGSDTTSGARSTSTSTDATILPVAARQESLPGAYAIAPTPVEADSSDDLLPVVQQTSDNSSNSIAQDEEAAIPDKNDEWVPRDSTSTSTDTTRTGDFDSPDNTTSTTAFSLPVGGTSETTNRQSSLVEAVLVPEDTLQSAADLPQAQDFDAAESARRRARRDKQFQTKVFSVSCLVLIVIVVILVAVVVLTPGNNEESSYPHSTNHDDFSATTPTRAPSPAASTTLHGSILDLLPQCTVRSIEEDPESPQAQAFQWLWDDIEQGDYLYDSSEEEGQMIQRFALATLYFATNGDLWTTNSNWLNHSVHECDWFQQSSFSLRDKRSKFISGYFEEFKNISGAPSCHNHSGLYQHLWLDQNNLVGSIPEELFLLTSLETLSIGRNRIEGTISTRVGQLTQLEGLVINGHAKVGTIPTEIGLLTKMRGLGLNTNELEGIFPTELWKLTNLQTILFGENPNLKGSIPSEIALMTNLRWLNMDSTHFSGTMPSELGLLQKAELIVFVANRLSGSLPTELGLLSGVGMFSVSQNQHSGTLPSELGLMTSLTILSLRDNQFSGEIPSEFGLLTSLSDFLNLQNNQLLSGTIPTQLGLLTKLHELEIQGNVLSGQVPSEFGQLASIGKLNVANNSLTGVLPSELAELQLHTLKLEGNVGLSGIVPEALCSLNGSCIATIINPCEGPYGLSFDCGKGSTLCGCGCSCG